MNKYGRSVFGSCISGFGLILLVSTAAVAQGQENQDSMPMFKQHRLGESAEQFFSIAKNWDGTLTTDFCASILREHKQVPKFHADECGHMAEALLGMNTELTTFFAEEIGTGTVVFVKGRLAGMRLFLNVPYANAVADMSSKLGVQPVKTGSIKNGLNSEGPVAAWSTESIIAVVGEMEQSIFPGQTMVRVEVRSLEKGVKEFDSSSTNNSLN